MWQMGGLTAQWLMFQMGSVGPMLDHCHPRYGKIINMSLMYALPFSGLNLVRASTFLERWPVTPECNIRMADVPDGRRPRC